MDIFRPDSLLTIVTIHEKHRMTRKKTPQSTESVCLNLKGSAHCGVFVAATRCLSSFMTFIRCLRMFMSLVSVVDMSISASVFAEVPLAFVDDHRTVGKERQVDIFNGFRRRALKKIHKRSFRIQFHTFEP